MNKSLMTLLCGIGIGVLVGYCKESEIDELCYKGRRAKKQMMRNLHSVKEYLD